MAFSSWTCLRRGARPVILSRWRRHVCRLSSIARLFICCRPTGDVPNAQTQHAHPLQYDLLLDEPSCAGDLESLGARSTREMLPHEQGSRGRRVPREPLRGISQRVHAYDGDASDIKSSPSSSPHVHHCGEISGAKYYLAEVVDAFSPGTKLDVHRPQGTSSAKATGKTAAVRAALPRSLHLHDHQHTMIDVRESLPQRPSLLPLNGTASGAKQPLVDEMKSALQEHHIPML